MKRCGVRWRRSSSTFDQAADADGSAEGLAAVDRGIES